MKIRASAIFLILAAHVLLVVHTAWTSSPTVDEVAHLPAGLSHWRFGRFDLYRVNPPLVQLVAAIPLLLMDDVGTDWHGYSTDKTYRAEFIVGRDFLKANESQVLFLFRWGRCACLVFTVVGAISVYMLAREFYGYLAGLLSLSLWCFSPMVIGNAAIITPDVPAAALSILATLMFYRWLRSPSLCRCLLSGMALALALLTKSTCLILIPCGPLIWIASIHLRDPCNKMSYRTELCHMALILVVALYGLNLGYLFDGSMQPLGDYDFVSQTFGGDQTTIGRLGNRFRDMPIVGRICIPLPCDFVHGIDLQKMDFEHPRWSYVNGTHQLGGWWWWYFYALGVKTPLGTILLVMMATVVAFHVRSFPSSVVLLIPAAFVCILVMSQVAFSRYLRYLLPVYPFIFVWCGQAALLRSAFSRTTAHRSWQGAVPTILLVWNVASCIVAHPHHLSYFNEIAGGSANGHWHLLDANVDWGQASLELKAWLSAHAKGEDVYLRLFDDRYCMTPEQLGIRSRDVPLEDDLVTGLRKTPPLESLPPGIYAISVNWMHGYRHHLGDPTCEVFLDARPIARIGNAIHVFRIPDQVLLSSP